MVDTGLHHCSIASGAENTFRFGPSYTVMRVKEFIPSKKLVWECVKHHHASPDLTQFDEWVGTRLIFQLEENTQEQTTHLHFMHEGLKPTLKCSLAVRINGTIF